MIIELFGLPASGKTTLAKRWESAGWIRVRLHSRRAILFYFLIFFFWHPLKTFSLFFLILRFAGDPARGYLKLANLFFYNVALYQKAARYQKAVLDQGPHQLLVSLFEHEQPSRVLVKAARLLPRPALLLVLSVEEKTRALRLSERGALPRAEFGSAAARSFAQAARKNFVTVFDHLRRQNFVTIVSDSATPEEIMYAAWSYVTFARMPTEKAHGVSIAHMCASFAARGIRVSLLIPARRNPITHDLFAYYRVPQTFSVQELPVFDFLGKGLSHPVFFFLHRFLFANAVRQHDLPAGVVYTRDPEIVLMLGNRHPVVFEAHRLPSGFWGWLTVQFIRKAALVVCNSQGTAEAFRERGITHLYVARNGFDARAFQHVGSKDASRKRLGIPPAWTVALYVGSLERWKGVETVYEASQYLTTVHTVVIGGSDAEVARLQKRYPNVCFLGARPYAQLADNLAAADMLILPNTTHDVQSNRFTSPIKLFGYMASGKPIIASDVPSIREIASDTEVLFIQPDNGHILAKAIERLAGQSDLQTALGHAAQLSAKHYTWDERAAAIVSAFQLAQTKND